MSARAWHKLRIILAIIIITMAYSAPIYFILKYLGNYDLPIIVSLIGSSVALITGIMALMREFILEAINAPSIEIQFLPNDNRDCHQTEFKSITTLVSGSILNRTKTHYFRFRIVNRGWKSAEGVEVDIEEVRRHVNGKYQIDKDYMPMRLYWSNWRDQRLELDIPSDTFRYCDLGFILEPGKMVNNLPASIDGAQQFWFDVIFRPNTGKTSLSPGRYEITVSATGKNVRKAKLIIEMDWLGGWEDKTVDLYKSHLKFTI